MNTAKYKELEEKIGYAFSDGALLARALTHSSYANEINLRGGGGKKSKAERVLDSEMFEFLGDAILGFIIAEELFIRKPGESEGALTLKRSAVICGRSLAKCARKIDLGGCLLLGQNMDDKRSRAQTSILSDAMEAVFAAVYIDGGLDAARGVILRCLAEPIAEAIAKDKIADYKTRLQEYYQANDNALIEYAVTSESGPAHKRSFTSQVTVNGRVMGSGTGDTKKESEQNAAREALQKIHHL